jgi:protein-tyrosine phosphatase
MPKSLRSPPIDASLVAPRLFVGSRPPPGRYRWFNVVVLCAKEYQPPSFAFPGMTVLRLPLVDDFVHPLSAVDTALVTSNARTIARYLNGGSCVLVTCRAGINRSALVAAIVMQLAYDMDADEAIEQIRDTRSPVALSNPRFEQFVRHFEETR